MLSMPSTQVKCVMYLPDTLLAAFVAAYGMFCMSAVDGCVRVCEGVGVHPVLQLSIGCPDLAGMLS